MFCSFKLVFDREWSNIQAGHTWAVDNAERDDEAAQLCVDDPEAGHHFLDLRLHPRERIRWQDLALAAAQKLKNRRAEGDTLGNLGIAWNQLGEARRAIECFDRALAIAREVGDRHGEGNALGNLGKTWCQLGDQVKAVELMEASLKILEGIESPKAGIVQQWLDQIRSG